MWSDFKTWIEYPSSQAVIVSVLGLIGFHVSPEYTKEIIEGSIAAITAIFAYKSDSDVAGK